MNKHSGHSSEEPKHPLAEVDKQQLIDFANGVPFLQMIGIETLDLAPGWSLSRVAYRPELCQPAGIMHGGVIATLIDTGIAHAILMTDSFRHIAETGASMVTVDLRVKYFRPVSEGTLTCECTVPRAGRHLLHCESVVKNDAGKEVARGDSIYMIVRSDRLRRA